MTTARWARDWAATWRTGWPAQGVEALAALHAPHGDHRAGIGRHFRGRDGLRAYLEECFAEETRPAEVWFAEPVVTGSTASVEYWAITWPGGAPLTIAGCTILLFGPDGLVVEARDYSHAEAGEIRPHSGMFLPEHLRSALEDLRRAYPDGLPQADYLPLLAAVEDDLSDRNRAAVVAALIGGDPLRVANDAAGDRPAPAEVDRVRDLLRRATG
ncbi:nuclear transport factor 2 family protein [Actinoplanes sp. CA-252034]|uniref:nuclear transport factor 2 family protein n=1 Tax=Actinoplanes sp. CA-252034 TaxID=3239906 RepID=UPI003D970B82